MTLLPGVHRDVRAPLLRTGCCAYSYRDYLTGSRTPPMALEDFLNVCAEIGIHGVELTSYYVPDPATPRTLHQLARRAFLLGLDITGTAVGNTFTVPPGEERDKQLTLVRRWVDLCPEMGGRYVRVFAGAAPEGVSEAQARQWVVECLRESCEYAGEIGVIIALENHGGVVATLDGMLEILRAVDSPWLCANLDTGNFHSSDPYADVAGLAPHAATVHVKTEMVSNGARSEADLERLAGILREAGYRGYMHLEYEAAEDAATAVPRILKQMLQLSD